MKSQPASHFALGSLGGGVFFDMEQALQFFRRHADAGVSDGDFDLFLKRMRGHGNLAFFVGELDGVIDTRRGKADGAFDKAMAKITSGPSFAGKTGLVKEMQDAHGQAKALGKRADAALAKPKSDRDATVAKDGCRP